MSRLTNIDYKTNQDLADALTWAKWLTNVPEPGPKLEEAKTHAKTFLTVYREMFMKLLDDTKNPKEYCSACGELFEYHPGLVGTCSRYQDTLKTNKLLRLALEELINTQKGPVEDWERAMQMAQDALTK